jgi:hypothetical protein
VSRLDSFIRRLMAQRACIDHAAMLVRDVPGPILEMGLGNGRTYDHLRESLRDREIYVCERLVAAHPDCVPPAPYLILGDARETLPQLWDKFARQMALVHLDLGTGEAAANMRLAAEVAPLIAPLMRPNAIVVSEPAIELPGWLALPLPLGVREGRYHLYRVS